jgi:uncharacterized DUF497 family protein
MAFEWDAWKAATNFKKHGVRFPEAESVFQDDYAITVVDNESDDDEQRFVTVGISERLRFLVIVFCYRGPNIRIISARVAENHERELYEENR